VTTDEGSAIERVWREQGSKIWRSLLEFTADPDLASDALAEAFAQALGRGDAIREPDRWIWRASFKIAAGELKDRRAIRSMDSPDRSIELPESVADLVSALQTLSPNQRAAAVLHYYADLPASEVAKILECSQTTVRVHLMQARRRLRPLLEVYDDV
jgi:RNA polymerase sigma-70 factor (ECF subfamily)